MLDEFARGLAELDRLGAHELAADGVIVLLEGEDAGAHLPLEEDELVKDDLGHREFGAPATGHDAHGAVGIAGERRLDGGQDLEGAESEHGWNCTGAV